MKSFFSFQQNTAIAQNIMNAEQFNQIIKQQQEEIERLREENEALKSQRPKYTCPQDEDLTGGDANYEYYYTTNEDGEMTIWKVPRHLAEIKSSTPNNWDNAVAECFRDEKFGENWDKLTYLIVREMKLKDLVKRKWKPAAEKPKEEEEEEEQAERDFFEGKEGGVIRWKPQAEDDEEELNSDDDDYEDKMAGKWECRRCGEKKAWSWVFDDLDCYYYCRECLDELEKDGHIEKGGDEADYQYKWSSGLEVM